LPLIRISAERINKITEQVNSCNYLENLRSYENEVNIDNKLNNHLKIAGNINNMCRPQKTLQKIKIELYSTLVLSALSHGIENWTIKARGARIIIAAEMILMRKNPGYTWALKNHKNCKKN
jgi:hypothetical protein